MTSEGTRGPADRLVELLEQLPGEERRAIMAWLLDHGHGHGDHGHGDHGHGDHGHGGPGQGNPAWPLPALLPALGATGTPAGAEVRIRRLTGTLSTGEDSQLVTIRLPAERHAELRAWCADHGFTMAAVIRGLVERFLEEHSPGKVDPAP